MINKFIPKKIKTVLRKAINKKYWSKDYNDMYNEFHKNLLKERQKIEGQIPKIDLKQKHVGSLKMLLNRNDMLTKLPKNAICAEIGVDKGEFSEKRILTKKLGVGLENRTWKTDGKKYGVEFKVA